jgi:hypothetical protein
MHRTTFLLCPVVTALVLAAPAESQQPARQGASASASRAVAPLAPRVMPAGRYEFTSTDDDGDVTAGAVAWSGQQMRIDLDRSRARSRRSGSREGRERESDRRGEYMLVDFATSTVRTIKPGEREISEMPLSTFEQIIGKALGMVGSVVQMQVRDAGILANDVGPVGEIAGVATRQFRMIEEYNVRIGVFGMNAEEKHHRVVTDYWVPTQAAMPRNPMFELLMRGANAMSQQDAVHQGNVSRARRALFQGFPMKVVTVTEAGESAKRSTVEITSLSASAPDAALFAMPSGYRVKKNDLTFTM